MLFHLPRLATATIGLVTLLCLASLQADHLQAENPADLKITNMERLNTSSDEIDPCIAPSGLSFYYASNAAKDFDLMMATRRQLSAPFTNPRPIEELNGKTDDVAPFALARDPDGSEYLFFASQRDAKNFDVFFTRRLRPDQPFQRIAVAPVHQICTEEDESEPCVSLDSREIYFSRKTKDGWRVGWAHGSTPRAFEKTQLIDFPPGFTHPAVSRDGLSMYLQGPLEKDRSGIYISKRASRSANWGKPEPVTVLNSSDGPKGDCCPALSADGAYLYFASDRQGGKGGMDLYYVATAELRKALQPK